MYALVMAGVVQKTIVYYVLIPVLCMSATVLLFLVISWIRRKLSKAP